MVTVLDRHEGRPPTVGPEGFEGHELVMFAPATANRSALGVTLSVVADRAGRRVSFAAVVLQQGADPVAVCELEVALPRSGWELRAPGLWADHVCESPLDHWSYGLEAFGLRLDGPEELLGRALGERVPIGWSLEFEAAAAAEWVAAGSSYRQTGVVHGLLLGADGSTEIEGSAMRSHWWAGVSPELEVGTPGAVVSELLVPTLAGLRRQTLSTTSTSSSSVASA